MSLLLFGDKIKGLKRATKVADCDEWLYEIHKRLVTLEEENKKLNERLDEKCKIIEELKNQIDSADSKEPSETHVQPRNWSSLFDKNVKPKKDTESEIILMAKIRDENRARTEKEKKIVLSGIIEGTKENERENEEDDWLKTCDLIKVIGIDNPTEIIT